MPSRPTIVLGGAALLLVLMSSACGRSDADTAAAVEAQLEKDPLTAPLDLTVSVTDAVATLSGTVSSPEEQARAIEIARGVVGVSQVTNALTFDPDALLASTVKSALAADPTLGAVPIEVEARNGFVRLTSDATNADQRERALAVARSVAGVKDVEDRMR